jgi:hypothetical protein
LIDKGITPATINWPEHLRNWYYAHGGSLDPVTRACIFGQKIQQAAKRLQEAIQAVAKGIFNPDREKDELTHALKNLEHPDPWKYGFKQYIESYRGWQRRKNKEREHLRRLEEQLLSHDPRMADEVKLKK